MPLERTVVVAAEHPAFDGHFPGQPILPGVVLLDEVVAAVESVFGAVDDPIDIRVAKFHATVAPDTPLVIRLSPLPAAATAPAAAGTRPAAVDFQVEAGDRRIASGRLDLGPRR